MNNKYYQNIYNKFLSKLPPNLKEKIASVIKEPVDLSNTQKVLELYEKIISTSKS